MNAKGKLKDNVYDCMQYRNGGKSEIVEFALEWFVKGTIFQDRYGSLLITTGKGTVFLEKGDFLLKDGKGNIQHFKEEDFKALFKTF